MVYNLLTITNHTSYTWKVENLVNSKDDYIVNPHQYGWVDRSDTVVPESKSGRKSICVFCNLPAGYRLILQTWGQKNS